MKDNMNKLKSNYNDIEIPIDLRKNIDTAFRIGLSERRKSDTRRLKFVAAFVCFSLILGSVAGLKMNPSFAKSLKDVPIIGQLVMLITSREILEYDKYMNAEIKIPKIIGMSDLASQDKINKMLAVNAQKVFESTKKEALFVKEMAEKSGIDKELPANAYQNYEMKSVTKKLLSFQIVTLKIGASGYETQKCYNIDLVSGKVISLNDLFKEKFEYQNKLKTIIGIQMKKQTISDAGASYFEDELKIEKNQNFYINKEGRLVITFDEYTIAPGSMGRPEFEIPTVQIEGGLLRADIIK